MDENQIVDGLAEALVKSGPYDPERSKEVAQGALTAIKSNYHTNPYESNKWNMEKTCLKKDLGFESLDFIEAGMELECALDIDIDKRDEEYWAEGRTTVLDFMQLGYEVKYGKPDEPDKPMPTEF